MYFLQVTLCNSLNLYLELIHLPYLHDYSLVFMELKNPDFLFDSFYNFLT